MIITRVVQGEKPGELVTMVPVDGELLEKLTTGVCNALVAGMSRDCPGLRYVTVELKAMATVCISPPPRAGEGKK